MWQLHWQSCKLGYADFVERVTWQCVAAHYPHHRNYCNHLKWMGWTDSDLEDGPPTTDPAAEVLGCICRAFQLSSHAVLRLRGLRGQLSSLRHGGATEILSSSPQEAEHVPPSGRWGQMATSTWQSQQPIDEGLRGRSLHVELAICSCDLTPEDQRAADVLRSLRTTDDPHCGPRGIAVAVVDERLANP